MSLDKLPKLSELSFPICKMKITYYFAEIKNIKIYQCLEKSRCSKNYSYYHYNKSSNDNNTSYHLRGDPYILSFPGGSAVKNPLANAGDSGSIPGSGRSCGEGNGNPLQYSCLGNPMARGAWQTIVHGVAELDTT